MFNVYTNVKFASLLPDRRGLSVSLSFDAPPGRARAPRAKARKQFWEGMSGKRMMQGGLIALVWKLGNEVAVHLGILAGSLRDLTESVSNSQDRVATRVVFFDPSIELRILHTLKNTPSHQAGTIILVEAPVMFEAIRPFLEALRVEPESIPFGKYLVLRPSDFFPFCGVEPPQYAKLPGFAYQLAPLFPPEAGVTDLKLFASNPTSIANARRELQRSRLDATQADAVVDALTREVALIQGPPGTGKSFTGVELLRVLIGCAKPILMIAFTNHALDHLMTSVLDAGITDKVVRLGSRSSDERMSQYSLEALELVVGKSRLDRSFGHHHRELKLVEEELKQLMKNFTRTEVTADEVMSYLQVQYPEHYEYLYQPPPWILAVKSLDDNTGWERAGKRGRHVIDDNSTYAFWMSGGDLRFLSTPNEPQMEIPLIPEVQTGSTNRFSALQELEVGVTSLSISDETPEDDENDVQEPWEQFWEESRPPREFNLPPPPPSQPVQASPSLVDPSQIQIADLRNPDAFFAAHGIDQIPPIPTLDRPLDGLLANGEIWTLSMTEREKLNSYWTQHVRESLHQNHLDDFASLRQKYADKLQVYNEGKNETRRQLLRDVDIVGCTTTGAAKLTSLLKGLGPRIMLVEEAGQVLEAHILGSLVPSIEHLILIGDPLQLRPTLNNYSLSVDSKTGSQLYKFDRSLMERLSSADFPMSQIDVQRRMRPTISNLIRRTLYPNLIDHELVKKYLDVRGFAKNVFFLTHTHKENGGTEESSSKFNTYEVDMIRDLVLYLLRQGCYSQEGDIVVLCAYLGQLARVRDALADAVAVVIDERDQEALADQEDEKSVDEDSHVEHVKVSKRVRLRTVDNYQGEEAKIIILSLVRNAGNIEDNPGARPTIGFLKSDNRTNVSLSRAKEGLFILGNSAQLASRSYMWRNVIAELEQEGHIGDAFPVACHRHPDSIMYISEPGKLPQFAPDGGCLRSCDARLKCGHVCPYKCHPDDPSHISVICVQPCTKLCPRRHPCHKECSEACGKCEFALSDVRLPCDHVNSSVPCHLIDQLEEVFCNVLITKQLPRCEHTAIMRCSDDASLYLCTSQCNGVAECCSRDCVANCHQCQSLNPTLDEAGCIPRTKHIEHPCRKILYCAHECTKSCSRDHECITSCKEPCRQECIHARCKQYCSTPCSPCQEPCTWRCAHYTCPLPCGSVCARLPCDKRCEYFLECGHGCPSVCGEDCSIQICPRCAPPEVKDKTVDFIMYRNLGDIAENEGTLDELLITLPGCGHVFTVETLDGICSINEYYTQSKDGAWLDLKSPDVSGSELKKPPVCPTCRAAITSPRYGRIFKSADLDILERNIISRMTSQLSAVQAMMESVSKANIEAKLLANVQNIKVDPIQVPAALQKSCVKAQRTLLAEARNSPIPLEAIMPENKHLFAISPSVTDAWTKATRSLCQVYAQAMKVAGTRSAHIHAWEAAWVCLYTQELERAASDPSRAPRHPREFALRMARMKVGQPQPRADKRFLVEAFWATLNVRFILADLGFVWLKAANKNGSNYDLQQRRAWAKYGIFVLDSCEKDAQTAFMIAKESGSRRQMTTTSLLIMRGNLELFRFRVGVAQESGVMKNTEERAKLAAEASSGASDAKEFISLTIREHLAVLPADRQDWIGSRFWDTARAIEDEWKNLEKSIRAETFYEPVSLDEKTAIVKALEFTHTGHFYNCPNGHTFVITECGGANQVSRCPECGERIGGSSHQLDAQNTRAMEFEDIARQMGTQASPWRWGV